MFGSHELAVDERPALRAYEDGPIVLGIRPEDFEDATHSAGLPQIETVCVLREMLGSEVLVISRSRRTVRVRRAVAGPDLGAGGAAARARRRPEASAFLRAADRRRSLNGRRRRPLDAGRLRREPSRCRAAHVRIPHREHSARIVLPDPRVERVEGRQAIPVSGRRQVELLTEERRRRVVRRVPVGLEHDILERDETKPTVRLGLVHDRLGRRSVHSSVADEAAFHVMDPHRAHRHARHGGHLDACDALRVLEQAVTVGLGGSDVVIADGPQDRVRQRRPRAAVAGVGCGRADDREGGDGSACDCNGDPMFERHASLLFVLING